MIIIPVSNTSPGYDGVSASERWREDANRFSRNCLRLSAFLHVKPPRNAVGRARACRSGPGTLPCVPRYSRGHSKLGVREPRIYEVTFLRTRATWQERSPPRKSRALFESSLPRWVPANHKVTTHPALSLCLVEYVFAREACF